MYKAIITNNDGKYCITYGEKEKVEAAVEAEMKLYPELEVYEHDYATYQEMDTDIPYIREDYATADVIEV